MCCIFGLVPVGVERELHPQPPDGSEQNDEAGQGAQAGMALECAGELADGPGEGEVEEQFQPAGAPLIAVVAVGGPQCRVAEMHRVTVSVVHLVSGVRHPTADGAAFRRGSQRGQRAAVNVGGGHRRRFLP